MLFNTTGKRFRPVLARDMSSQNCLCMRTNVQTSPHSHVALSKHSVFTYSKMFQVNIHVYITANQLQNTNSLFIQDYNVTGTRFIILHTYFDFTATTKWRVDFRREEKNEKKNGNVEFSSIIGRTIFNESGFVRMYTISRYMNNMNVAFP